MLLFWCLILQILFRFESLLCHLNDLTWQSTVHFHTGIHLGYHLWSQVLYHPVVNLSLNNYCFLWQYSCPCVFVCIPLVLTSQLEMGHQTTCSFQRLPHLGRVNGPCRVCQDVCYVGLIDVVAMSSAAVQSIVMIVWCTCKGLHLLEDFWRWFAYTSDCMSRRVFQSEVWIHFFCYKWYTEYMGSIKPGPVD